MIIWTESKKTLLFTALCMIVVYEACVITFSFVTYNYIIMLQEKAASFPNLLKNAHSCVHCLTDRQTDRQTDRPITLSLAVLVCLQDNYSHSKNSCGMHCITVAHFVTVVHCRLAH